MKISYFLPFAFLLLLSCQQQTPLKPQQHYISIQPFADIPDEQVKYVENGLTKLYPTVTVNKKMAFPSNAMNAAGYRYKADSLLNYLSKKATKGEIILGLTGRDISTTMKDKPDWGIFGLGLCPGNACIASSFRFQHTGIDHFYKIVLHELGHAEGLKHCPVVSCFMRDAEGGDTTGDETGFCAKCSTYLKERKWKL